MDQKNTKMDSQSQHDPEQGSTIPRKKVRKRETSDQDETTSNVTDQGSDSHSKGLIVPKILKKKDHDLTQSAQAPQEEHKDETPQEDMMPREEVLQEGGDLPWKQLAQSTLQRKVCAVACCRPPFPPNVSFHRIPKVPSQRKAWIAACKRKDKKFNPSTSYVCSQHFKDEDMERDLKSELMNNEKRMKLKPGVVPSQKLLPSTQTQDAMTPRAARAEKKKLQEIVQCSLADNSDLLDPVMDNIDLPGEESCSKEELLEENKALKERIMVLESELEETKKHPNLTEKDKVLIAKEIMYQTTWSKQQVDHFLDDKQRTRWSSKDIVLGLTIRGLSKKVYQYLRTKKLMPLPSLTTLRQHIRSFTCSPGIQESILEGKELWSISSSAPCVCSSIVASSFVF